MSLTLINVSTRSPGRDLQLDEQFQISAKYGSLEGSNNENSNKIKSTNNEMISRNNEIIKS